MSRWITDWRPDDEDFWRERGEKVARRNLSFSIFTEFLGFSVWLLWSIVAANLNDAGFAYTVGQLFWLVSVPALVGATLRFPYTFAVARFGGRNWTVISALLLLIPVALLVVMVGDPGTPYGLMLAAAATAGFGGGNFASSMVNISYFYPDDRKGFPLALNAAGGNIGVAVVQAFVPLVITVAIVGGQAGGGPFLVNAGLIWIPLILLAAGCAWFFMNNLKVSTSEFREQVSVARNHHTWIMSVLYIGTFGSFIGYSGALPILLTLNFPDAALKLAFLGALVGALARPLGGLLSDRLGGARVTLWNFGVMILAALGVVFCLQNKAEPWAFAAFLGMFMVLFVATGIGNGSTFRMIPVIFRSEALRRSGDDREGAIRTGKREAAAVLGVSSAIGAYGGFLIPQAFNLSGAATGGPEAALSAFIGFYLVCAAITWWCYVRQREVGGRRPVLGEARA